MTLRDLTGEQRYARWDKPRMDRRKALGICPWDGNPLGAYKVCDSCRKRLRKIQQDYKERKKYR